MTLETDSKGTYRATRLTAFWTQTSARNEARVRPRFKAGTFKNRLSLLFIFGTLSILASIIRMWSHWFEISAVLGFYRAGATLTAVTGAALIFSWWLNRGNE